jgi:hypothetical protein
MANQLEIGIDFSADDKMGVITTQYILLAGKQIGGIPALNNCYRYNKPIELNETAYINSWIKEDDSDLPAISRIESWEFMVGGGAAFNQLNGFFIVPNPSGESKVNHKVLQGLKNLRLFLESFDYIRMTRDRRTAVCVSIGANINMISEKGKQYAIYMHHSFPHIRGGTWYEPNYNEYAPVINLSLESGKYRVIYYEPETMKILKEEYITTDGSDVEITCPKYSLDIAIKITA